MGGQGGATLPGMGGGYAPGMNREESIARLRLYWVNIAVVQGYSLVMRGVVCISTCNEKPNIRVR